MRDLSQVFVQMDELGHEISLAPDQQRIITRSARLILRELCLADAMFIQQLVNEPGWLTYIGDKQVHCLADACRYLKEGPLLSYRRDGFGLYAVTLLDNTPVGLCGLLRREPEANVEIGYAILEQYQRRGFAQESIQAVLTWRHKILPNTALTAVTSLDNRASQALLSKLGFHQAGFQQRKDQQPCLLFQEKL